MAIGENKKNLEIFWHNIEFFIISSKWVGGRSVQMKGIMEMRMETVPARHTGDLCRGLICKWRNEEEDEV